MASPVLWSEAFISTIPHPMSRARASAEEVFPMPGVPMRTSALLDGAPLFHCSAHCLIVAAAEGLPTMSFSDWGLYFSVQSSAITDPSCYRAL